MVTWKDLTPTTKCIYQAFTKALDVQGSVLAAEVNAKGVDADDGNAVLILAQKHGFKCEGAFTAAFMADPVNYRPEANSHLICVITTSGDTTKAPGIREMFQSTKQLGATDPERPLFDRRFQDVQWHAIYGKSDMSHKITKWQDDQGQRSSGPLTGDFCVIFSKPIS